MTFYYGDSNQIVISDDESENLREEGEENLEAMFDGSFQ